jgi:hypothetical protein
LSASPEPAAWIAALELVRGRPFEGLDRADWTVLEGFVADMEEGVVDLALRLADHLLPTSRAGQAPVSAGSAADAARAARRALRASPFDERLYRVLLRAADAQGNPGGVESVMRELGWLLRPEIGDGGHPAQNPVDLSDLVHPETAALYRSLSRHPADRRRRSGRATRGVVIRL